MSEEWTVISSLISNLPDLFEFGTPRVLEEDKQAVRSGMGRSFGAGVRVRSRQSSRTVSPPANERGIGDAADGSDNNEYGGAETVGSSGRDIGNVGSRGETVAEVAHDARNMVTALGLYCDLLEEPGVLANPFAHYGSELRLVAAASRRLVEKLVAIDTDQDVVTSRQAHTKRRRSRSQATGVHGQ